MQLTQIFTILALAVAGVVAAPGGHGGGGGGGGGGGHQPPPVPTNVVQTVLLLMPLYFASSNSMFRSTAVTTPTRTAAPQINLRDIPAWVFSLRLLTATLLPFAATTIMV